MPPSFTATTPAASLAHCKRCNRWPTLHESSLAIRIRNSTSSQFRSRKDFNIPLKPGITSFQPRRNGPPAAALRVSFRKTPYNKKVRDNPRPDISQTSIQVNSMPYAPAPSGPLQDRANLIPGKPPFKQRPRPFCNHLRRIKSYFDTQPVARRASPKAN